jgi:hypothetical protein
VCVKRCGELLIAPDRGHRPVPEPSLWVSDYLGEGRVHLEHLRWGGCLPNGGALERMTEPQLGVEDLNQLCLDRCVEARELDRPAEKGTGRFRDFRKRSAAVERGGQQHRPGVIGKVVQPCRERLL